METSYKSDSNVPVASSARRVAKEKLRVCVYTPTDIFNGYIYCLHKQRLLDLLNSLVVGTLYVGADFLPVTKATNHIEDDIKTTEIALVNKSNILFISEIKQQVESNTEASFRLPPVRERLPIIAKLHLPPYILCGQMHCAKGQRLSDLLNTKEKFIPMTNVDIVPSSGIQQVAEFVAVNKTQIIYVEEMLP